MRKGSKYGSPWDYPFDLIYNAYSSGVGLPSH